MFCSPSIVACSLLSSQYQVDGTLPANDSLDNLYATVADAWTALTASGLLEFSTDNQFHDRSVSCITMKVENQDSIAEDPSNDKTYAIAIERNGLPDMRGKS